MAGKRKGSRRLTKAAIRKRYAPIRATARKLQRKGLISSRADLSRAKPSLSVRKKAAALRGVTTGFQEAVTVGPATAKRYREAGFKVVGRKVIIEKTPEETLTRNRRGEIEMRNPWGNPFTQIILPVNMRNLPAFRSALHDHTEEFQKMAGPGGYFGFSFYGNKSYETGDAQWLASYLDLYESLWEDGGDDDGEYQATPFRNLILYRMDERGRYAWARQREAATEADRKHRKGTRRNAWAKADYTGRSRSGLQPSSVSPEKQRAQDAIRSKRYRARMAQKPGFHEAEASRKRAARKRVKRNWQEYTRRVTRAPDGKPRR